MFHYRKSGKRRDMGLGPVRDVSLAEARQLAADARKALRDGADPIEVRRAERAGKALAEASATTFKKCAEKYIEAHKVRWKSDKHAKQWAATLERYVYPDIGAVPVGAVDVALVLKVLKPVWSKKPETANRVRGRIELVLDWAKARNYRTGDNPARWKGGLKALLPARSTVKRVQHFRALPYSEIGAFMRDLRT